MALIKPEQLRSGSYSISGSFSGSFIGDGTQLSGIAASKWSGSNPITRDSNVEITGLLSINGSTDVSNQLTANTISVQTIGSNSATLISNALTTSKNYHFPNKQGTLSLREDLPNAGSGLTQIITTPDTFKLGGVITENTTFTDDTNQYYLSLDGPNLYLYKASNNSAPTIRLNRASGSASTPLPPLAFNYLGVISAGGYDTGVLAGSAALIFQASENFTSSSRGTDLFFNTTPNGTNIPIRRLTIKNDGIVIITGSLEITGSLSVSGSLIVTTSVTASSYTGSFVGDGSQLTAITASVLTGFDPNSSTFTIELIDVLTLDFYAPFDMQINTVTDLVNTPTTTLEVEDVAYVLEDPISAGDKITVTVDTAAVVQLNAERI